MRLTSRRHLLQTVATCGLLALTLGIATACAGPDTGDDMDPTPTSVPTEPPATPTATVEPTATATPTLTATATSTTAASPTLDASPDASPTQDDENATPDGTTTATVTTTGTPGGTATSSATADGTQGAGTTATAGSTSLTDRLPTLQQLPSQAYIVATTGSRTAQELANAYADPVAHLRRLDEWGFVQHVYREFARQDATQGNLPALVLTTINVYGSPEQADAALQWLHRFQTSIGAADAEAPARGDAAVAVTVNTAGGEPTASIYVRVGELVYAFYAEGGDALAFTSGIVTNVIAAD